MNRFSKYDEILNSIPPSDTEVMLKEWGYNFSGEYAEMAQAAELNPVFPVYDFATGTGRMAAVLSRMKYNVVTGDITDEQRGDALNRLGKEYLNKVTFVFANLEELQYDDNSLENIVCVNTLHHLKKPLLCINELLRVVSKTGTILIADFNGKGFDVMDEVHKRKYNDVHERGIFSREDVDTAVRGKFQSVMNLVTDLNWGIVLKGKL